MKPRTPEHRKKMSDAAKARIARWMEEDPDYCKKWSQKLANITRGVARNPTGVVMTRKDINRKCHIKTLYGKTLEQHQADLERQGHACALCLKKSTARLCYDHDHRCCGHKSKTCGKCVRGLICHKCNRALGYFDDSIERLKQAIEYLEAWNNGNR